MDNSSNSSSISNNVLITPEKKFQFISKLNQKNYLLDKLTLGLINGQYLENILEIWEDVKSKKIDYLSFVHRSFSLITIVVPKIGITVPFLLLFFPEISGMSSTMEIPNIFTALKQDMQNIENLTLTAEQAAYLDAEIKKIKKAMQIYINIFNEIQWNHAGFFAIYNHIDVMITKFIDFIETNFHAFHCPYFSLYATIHLMINRDMIIHGRHWGFSVEFINQKKTNIKKLIQRYSSIGDTLFEKDLNMILNNESPLTSNKVDTRIHHILHWFGPDVYRLWPSLDPCIYPIYTYLKKTKTICISDIRNEKILQDKMHINHIAGNDWILNSSNNSQILNNIDTYTKNSMFQYNLDYHNDAITDADLNIISNNMIVDIDNWNKTTYLSSIVGVSMTNYSNNQGKLVTEWINGGSTVKLGHMQIITIPLLVLDTHVYQIRLRYATENNVEATMWMCIRNNQTDNIFLNTKLSFAAPMNFNFIQGKHGKYVINTIETDDNEKNITLSAGSYTIFIRNIMEKNLFLDRIEFYKQTIDSNTSILIPGGELRSPSGGGPGWTNLWVAEPNQIGKTFEAVNSVNGGEYKFYFHGDLVGSTQGNAFYEDFDTVQIYFYNCLMDSCNSFAGAKIWIENSSLEYFKRDVDLERIKKQVNSLFISNFDKQLNSIITDYWIDQVALKVKVLSNEIFGKEKLELRKLVNYAKQLSKTRNLLVGGNFENLDMWYVGKKVTVIEEKSPLKGEQLLLPPPIDSLSYAYQKIDESKLKKNTRYIISGFIAQAISLNIIVSRYGNEINKVLNVLGEESGSIYSEEITNYCISHIPFTFDHKMGMDSNFFCYGIHVGDIQTEYNLGIEFCLRITSPTGFAKVSNIEIYEERSLTQNEIRSLKRTEKKWKKSFEQSRIDLHVQLQPVIKQINSLYQGEDWNKLIHSQVMFQDVQAIKLPDLPRQTHWLMKDRADENYVIMQQMTGAIQRAFTQLKERNLILNGNFSEGLTGWIPDGNYKLIVLDEQNKALSLLHWDTSIKQSLKIPNFNTEQEYQLRVYGKGNGTIMIQHGNKIESMNFSSSVFMSKPSRYIVFENSDIEIYIVSEGTKFIIDNIQLIQVT
uniref:Crystaline entomocidal protoxin n=1 Tax=Bacillus thuringiensis TaxID=1428 RepID=H9E8W1_BACTU|nr:Cry-like protein [Bacillus thuringiensis]